MRIRSREQMMACIKIASEGVGRLRVFVERIGERTDFIAPVVSRRDHGTETVLVSPDRDRVSVYRLSDRDPLVIKERDPLATFLHVGSPDNKVAAIGILPHSADPFWHGVRLLVLMKELLAERELDRMPRPRLVDWRANINAHCEMANYENSRLALDLLDARFGGRIRHKAADARGEGLLRGPQLVQRMRAFISFAIEMEFHRSASEEEEYARVLITTLSLPALLDPPPVSPFN